MIQRALRKGHPVWLKRNRRPNPTRLRHASWPSRNGSGNRRRRHHRSNDCRDLRRGERQGDGHRSGAGRSRQHRRQHRAAAAGTRLRLDRAGRQVRTSDGAAHLANQSRHEPRIHRDDSSAAHFVPPAAARFDLLHAERRRGAGAAAGVDTATKSGLRRRVARRRRAPPRNRHSRRSGHSHQRQRATQSVARLSRAAWRRGPDGRARIRALHGQPDPAHRRRRPSLLKTRHRRRAPGGNRHRLRHEIFSTPGRPIQDAAYVRAGDRADRLGESGADLALAR